MTFIRILEGIRNPGLDLFFSFITKLGEEDIFIIISLFIFWCINKKKGFYLLVVGFAGTLANQFLKITFNDNEIKPGDTLRYHLVLLFLNIF